MRFALPSSLLRHSLTRQVVNKQRASTSKRFASSTESSQHKAQDALGAAQKTAEKLWESAQKFLGPLGEKAGNLLGCMSIIALKIPLVVQPFECCRVSGVIASCTGKLTLYPVPAYKEPVIYNFAVTRELFKQIYIKEGLHPPSIAAFREAYASIWSQVTNPGFVGTLIRSGEIGRVGIHGLQAYGIFKVSNPSSFYNHFVEI